MSLGGGASSAINTAIDALFDAGVPVSVAAGNDNNDACDASPAGADKAFTVGATTSTDSRAYFSSYGSCMDLWAPGMSILVRHRLRPSSETFFLQWCWRLILRINTTASTPP
jgi:cerevisin